MSTTQQLYLKEFFGNYIQRRHKQQIINSVLCGLQVLQTLVGQFEQKYEIEYMEKGEIDHGEDQIEWINFSFERMYKRLNRIFAEWKDGVEKCQEWSEGNKSAKIREDDDDDDDDDDEDLYEMLNEYKADNKKLKEIRNVLQRECKQLKERIELLIEDKKERSQRIDGLELQLQHSHNVQGQLKEQLQTTKSSLCVLQIERDELSILLDSHKHLASQVYQLQCANTALQGDLQAQLETNKELTGRLANYDQFVAAKLKEKDGLLQSIIVQAVYKQQVWEHATAAAFKRFVRCLDKDKLGTAAHGR